ncbi:L,D-transpeptidase family protein [Fusobacterium ulcerans]|uniref:L,D-transpeptidase family protein n=1 Tax=Fusobacterium ulcerans TaxID=861 RepID=UPI001032E84C|nr:SH3 domain-containing protein [Fusobacterium ulcerans]
MRLLKTALISLFMIGTAAFSFEGDASWTTVAIYDNEMPENIILNEKYNGGHPKVLDYVFVRTRTANLRELPSTKGKIIKKFNYDTKLKALEKIYDYGNYWYKVETDKGEIGYISSMVVRKRVFRFEKAIDKIKELENFIAKEMEEGREVVSTNSYVPNPNNVDFKREKDKYGTSLDQNIVGWYGKEKIFVPDRSVLSIVEPGDKTSKVHVASIKEPLVIENKRISRNPKIDKNFRKVIAIDIENQNVMVFEKNEDNKWEVISYVYSKTGIESEVGFETPKGFFIAPMVKYIMPYNSEVGEKQGYARYAIRFSGGGYLHGTPLNYDEDANREFFMKQKEKTLGTFTGTRKCVRTTEPHAKYLFEWMVKSPNKSRNEQVPDENVMFVIF